MTTVRTGVACLLLLTAAGTAAQTPLLDPPELRALWVDAFHEGIRSPQEADDLVAAARRANINTLFVQVRRRGDALYTKGEEPPLDDPAYDPAFDALACIVEAGHRSGLEVHAWINAMPVWRDETPPKDPRHVFNRHGTTAIGDDNWLTSSPTGNHRFPVGYFLDPGHPAAAEYLVGIYLNIVRSYSVDGIHFDYIRYPETDERLPRGSGVGYNAVNLARFRKASGRSDTPAPGDEAWMQWRRDQVTYLVRRVAIEAKAINPRIRVSAALIPWGRPPTSETDFEDVAPMQRIFQDWHQWLKDGLLDLGVPMNYASETDVRVRGWFDGWIAWEKHHSHGRHLAVGLGAYRNLRSDTLVQVRRARTLERKGGALGVAVFSHEFTRAHARTVGVSFFSYAVPEVPAAVKPGTDLPAVPVTGVERLAYLVDGVGDRAGVFARPAPIPRMPWIDAPTDGWLAGIVRAGSPGDNDGAVVKIKRKRFWPFGNTRRVRTDGNGFYGLAKVKPGRYEVSLDERARNARPILVRVIPGQVARVPTLIP